MNMGDGQALKYPEVQEICSRRSTLDGLRDKKRDLEARIVKVNEAIDLFEKNPDVARAIDLLSSFYITPGLGVA